MIIINFVVTCKSETGTNLSTHIKPNGILYMNMNIYIDVYFIPKKCAKYYVIITR